MYNNPHLYDFNKLENAQSKRMDIINKNNDGY